MTKIRKRKEYVKRMVQTKVYVCVVKKLEKGYLSTHLKTTKHKTEAESKP
jgi:hypothetical protein